MSETRGHIELDRAIDSIVVGIRHRKDPGDLNPLMESIERIGLLQPITITPEGVLVCGWRRLEAVRRLGWHSHEGLGPLRNLRQALAPAGAAGREPAPQAV